ncbi:MULTISPECIES: DUF2846 domain-containing protein [Halomonas]|uniref:DUF2846 domain-containing protein n=1 Tax=Halomonas TaxID=2745 RepID=UPI0011B1FE9C|nr:MULTISPECIES: DUF2846 domain-containing protein [Halomonas]
MKRTLFLIAFSFISGCAATDYKDLNLDTTSDFRSPTHGKSGVYVYQWKTGILGAGSDVDFEIKGYPELSLNTGEYGYFEVKPGNYEYKLSGGIFPQYIPVEFEPDQNYFFRAFLLNFSDYAVLVREQNEINEAQENISSGRYEPHSND